MMILVCYKLSHRGRLAETCLSLSLTIFSIPGVDYLECDLGQTEFTPPGCISLLNITEPLLGKYSMFLMSQATHKVLCTMKNMQRKSLCLKLPQHT